MISTPLRMEKPVRRLTLVPLLSLWNQLRVKPEDLLSSSDELFNGVFFEDHMERKESQ